MTDSPLERQWLILKTLGVRRFGATVKELAAEHGVSLKTIRRDLKQLQKLGFAVEEKQGAYGRNHWSCRETSGITGLGLNITEVMSLFLAREMLVPLTGSLIWEGMESFLKKVQAVCPVDQWRYFQKLNQTVKHLPVRTSHYADKQQMIDDLMVACEDQLLAEITYQSARSTEPVSYYVHSYGLIHYQNSLYLIANSQHHQEIRHFKVDRLHGVQLQGLKFNKPGDFDLQNYLTNNFGLFHHAAPPQLVRIRFSEQVQQYVLEHRWHKSQQSTRDRQGRLIVSLQVSGFTTLKSWLLSFGFEAEILEPLAWREELQQELVRTLQVYQTRPTPREKTSHA